MREYDILFPSQFFIVSAFLQFQLRMLVQGKHLTYNKILNMYQEQYLSASVTGEAKYWGLITTNVNITISREVNFWSLSTQKLKKEIPVIMMRHS